MIQWYDGKGNTLCFRRARSYIAKTGGGCSVEEGWWEDAREKWAEGYNIRVNLWQSIQKFSSSELLGFMRERKKCVVRP